MPAKNKVLSRLSSLWIARTTVAGAATTLSAAAAKAAGTLTVTSIAGFSSGQAIRIGSGNDMELNKINGAPAGSTITLAWPLQRAHIALEDVKQMTVYDHGAPDEGGVDVVVSGEVQDVMIATQRMPLTNVKGYMSAGGEWAWPFADLNTFVTAMGALLSRITGSGTVSAPKQYITDGNDSGEETDVAVIAGGVLVDGTFVYVELWGVSMDYTAIGKIQFRRGQPVKISARARASAAGVMTTVAPAYTIDVSKRAQKNQVWRALSEVGLRTPAGSGMNSTLTANAAAGAQTLVVAASAGAASGDRIKVGTGSDAEYPVVDTVPDGVSVTLRTKLLRAHVIGETVVEQTNTVFAGVGEDGASLEIAGSVRTIRKGDTPLEAGTIPGDCQITVGVMLFDILMANVAYALGIPQADIVRQPAAARHRHRHGRHRCVLHQGHPAERRHPRDRRVGRRAAAQRAPAQDGEPGRDDDPDHGKAGDAPDPPVPVSRACPALRIRSTCGRAWARSTSSRSRARSSSRSARC
jgi:hypothetical protein